MGVKIEKYKIKENPDIHKDSINKLHAAKSLLIYGEPLQGFSGRVQYTEK